MNDEREKIRLNQVWQSNRSSMRVEVVGKKNDCWKCRVLTERHGVYNGSHTLNTHTLRARYTLVGRDQLQMELDASLVGN